MRKMSDNKMAASSANPMTENANGSECTTGENILDEEQYSDFYDLLYMKSEMPESSPFFGDSEEARNEALLLFKNTMHDLEALKAITDRNDEDAMNKIKGYEDALMELKEYYKLTDPV